MNIHKQIQDKYLESQIPLLVFVVGLSFCIIIRIINIYGMVTGIADWNYFISKKYAGMNYIWFCELSLASFCFLSLVLLIRSNGKMFSIALIVSCLSIMSNVAFMKAGMRIGHMDWIIVLENEIASEETHQTLIPRYKKWYSINVDRWNEIEKNKFEPTSGAYLDNGGREGID